MFNLFKLTLATLLVLNFSHLTNGQSACQTTRMNNVISGKSRIRGSNLGSWLVLESWMAPKLWSKNHCKKGTTGGSYLLEKCLGSKAQAVMEKHWSSWITEADFEDMSKNGVNLVRLPIGWWQIYDPQGGAIKAHLNYNISSRDYVTGGLAYIDKALEWGKKHGIAVLLCLHAAPGSQNGNGHSSPAEHPGKITWDKYPANVGQTVDSLSLYTERYANHTALYGFGLLNEPAHLNMTVLQNYYKRVYAEIRKHCPNCHIVLNPLISPFESGTEEHWTNFMNPDQGFKNVAMDLHYYSCFGGKSDSTDADKAISYINNDRKAKIVKYIKKNPKPMLIGEWSSCGHFSTSRTSDFTRAQVNVYNTANLGWTFWSWTNGAPGNRWSLKTAFNSNWLDKIIENVC